MPCSKHIVIVAGEESGDVHAAAFVRELTSRHPLMRFSGIGGKHMQEAGVELVSDLARFGVTGLTEVLRHFKVIRHAYRAIQAHLNRTKPSLLILVDYPGFNLRLARFAKEILGIRVLYYVSPQIWAWKANRIHLIRRYVDRMAVILPFEKPLYERAGVPVSFVGHPLVDTVIACKDVISTRLKLKLPTTGPILALLPGSRVHEIERHMPTLIKAAQIIRQQQPTLHFVIPIARTIDRTLIEAYLTNTAIPYTLVDSQAVETVSCSDYVIVASGTASLECALLLKPMCIIYKASLLTYLAATKVIKVRYLGLCNLLQNQMIAPELLQYDCNPIELARVMLSLMTEDAVSDRMIKRLQCLKESLSLEQADLTISQLIEHEIGLFVD